MQEPIIASYKLCPYIILSVASLTKAADSVLEMDGVL